METEYPQCVMTILETHSDYVWVRGVSGLYTFDAKVYRAGSSYGVRNGRVSKLAIWLRADGRGRPCWVVNYDRGWDIRPQKEHRQLVESVIRLLETLPQPEDMEGNLC